LNIVSSLSAGNHKDPYDQTKYADWCGDHIPKSRFTEGDTTTPETGFELCDRSFVVNADPELRDDWGWLSLSSNKLQWNV